MTQQPEEGKASVKNIKDYLHLYLGFGMYNQGLADHLYKKGIPYTPQKLRTVGSDGLFWVGSEEDSREMSTTNFKPILRPLSDMTNEDEEATGLNATYEYGHHTFTPSEFIYFLSKGFDLFGLIESGLAIDATKIKNNV